MALDPGPLIIAAVALPGHPPFPGDRLDVAIALGGIGVGCGAEHGIGTGWNDHLYIWMTLVQSGVYVGSIIAAVAHEDLHRLGDLVEQGIYLGGVIDVGQEGGNDPAGHRVKADMQLAPGAPLAGTVLLHSPGPPSFSPQLSTSRWTPVARVCAGSSRRWARRLRVEK
jgi:hypothetical protein